LDQEKSGNPDSARKFFMMTIFFHGDEMEEDSLQRNVFTKRDGADLSKLYKFTSRMKIVNLEPKESFLYFRHFTQRKNSTSCGVKNVQNQHKKLYKIVKKL
jgi:hypothetical protein